MRLPWLWWCAGLALVMLVASAGTPTISASSAGVGEHSGSVSAAPGQALQGDHHRYAASERGALKFETSDEDEQPDTPAVSPVCKLVRACGLRGRALSLGPVVDTGHRLVSTGLARGPPVAS